MKIHHVAHWLRLEKCYNPWSFYLQQYIYYYFSFFYFDIMHGFGWKSIELAIHSFIHSIFAFCALYMRYVLCLCMLYIWILDWWRKMKSHRKNICVNFDFLYCWYVNRVYVSVCNIYLFSLKLFAKWEFLILSQFHKFPFI